MRNPTKYLILVMLATVPFVGIRLYNDSEPAIPVADSRPTDAAFDNDSVSADRTRAAVSPDSIAGILELRTDFAQTQAAFALAAAADSTELRALIAEAQDVASNNDRIALTGILIQRYAEIDPAAAARFVAQSTLEAKRELIYMIFNSWSKVELDAALAGVDDLDAALDRRNAGLGILAAVLDSDVGALGDIAERLAANGVSDTVSPSLVARVAAIDLEVALQMANTIGTDRTREAALANVLTTWAASDAVAAIAALERFEISGSPELLSNLGKAFARQSPAEAIEWVNSSRDYMAIMTVMAEVARHNPAYLLEVLRNEYTAVQQQGQVEQILQRMSLDDPSAAVVFWRQLPAELRPAAARSIIIIWAQRDPVEAEAWVLSLAQQAERQAALRALLIMHSASNDASRFARLVAMLDSAEDRDTYGFNQVASLVRSGDPEAAVRQLALISLSPDYYRRAREAIDKADR